MYETIGVNIGYEVHLAHSLRRIIAELIDMFILAVMLNILAPRFDCWWVRVTKIYVYNFEILTNPQFSQKHGWYMLPSHTSNAV